MDEDELVKLRWLCTNFVGQPYWQTVDIYECDECGCEFETEEDAEEVKEKLCTAICPRCGAQQDMRYDDPEVIKKA